MKLFFTLPIFTSLPLCLTLFEGLSAAHVFFLNPYCKMGNNKIVFAPFVN